MLGMLTGRAGWYTAAGLAAAALGLVGAVKIANLELEVAQASSAVLERTIAQQAAEVQRVRREREIASELIAERDQRDAARDAQLASLRSKVRVMEKENDAIRAMGECLVPDSYISDWLQLGADGRNRNGADVPAGNVSPRDAGAGADRRRNVP